ncbi:uncharacterized protein [Oscarella lobularis]|uniref:uncharacterized protein n=1 Tax=Oscarella lobularis TaxID=121494 RepID=UPI003313961B
MTFKWVVIFVCCLGISDGRSGGGVASSGIPYSGSGSSGSAFSEEATPKSEYATKRSTDKPARTTAATTDSIHVVVTPASTDNSSASEKATLKPAIRSVPPTKETEHAQTASTERDVIPTQGEEKSDLSGGPSGSGGGSGDSGSGRELGVDDVKPGGSGSGSGNGAGSGSGSKDDGTATSEDVIKPDSSTESSGPTERDRLEDIQTLGPMDVPNERNQGRNGSSSSRNLLWVYVTVACATVFLVSIAIAAFLISRREAKKRGRDIVLTSFNPIDDHAMCENVYQNTYPNGHALPEENPLKSEDGVQVP